MIFICSASLLEYYSITFKDHRQENLNQYPVIFPSKINIAEKRTNGGLRLL